LLTLPAGGLFKKNVHRAAHVEGIEKITAKLEELDEVTWVANNLPQSQ
jgi:hypothetical protein